MLEEARQWSHLTETSLELFHLNYSVNMKAISFKGTDLPLFPLAVRLKAVLKNIRRQVISVRFSKKHKLLWQTQNWNSYNWTWSSRSPGSRIRHRCLLHKWNLVSDSVKYFTLPLWYHSMGDATTAWRQAAPCWAHYGNIYLVLAFSQQPCNPVRGSRQEIQASGSQIRARWACRALTGASVIFWFTKNSKTCV